MLAYVTVPLAPGAGYRLTEVMAGRVTVAARKRGMAMDAIRVVCLATQGAALRVTSMPPVLLTLKTRWRSPSGTSGHAREFDITRRGLGRFPGARAG